MTIGNRQPSAGAHANCKKTTRQRKLQELGYTKPQYSEVQTVTLKKYIYKKMLLDLHTVLDYFPDFLTIDTIVPPFTFLPGHILLMLQSCFQQNKLTFKIPVCDI